MPSTTVGCAIHPERTGSLTCAACGRGICLSCVHQQSDGPRCPVCVRNVEHSEPETQTLPAVAAPRTVRTYRPILTIALVLGCVAVFAYDWWTLGDWVLTGGQRELWQVPEGGLGEWTLYRPQLVAEGEWYRVVSSGFVHFNLVHLGINMVALWALATVIERVYGALTLGTLFVAGLMGGSLGAVIVESDVQVGGASGAIFALLGAIAMLQLVAGRNIVLVTVVILINIGLSFLPFVAFGGHMGGLIVGAIAGLMLGLCRRSGARAVAIAPILLAALAFATFLVLVQVVAPGQLSFA